MCMSMFGTKVQDVLGLTCNIVVQCEAYVLALPVWTHLGSEECVANVKATLQTRMKEEVR